MRIVLVTGTVGVGKSTVGFAAAERASADGVTAAFLDVDELSRLLPAPKDDPFRDGLILTNLRSIVPNYKSAGASILVLAWVIESDDDLHLLEVTLECRIAAVRLVSPLVMTEERLRNRHQGAASDGLAWHLRRAPELARIQSQLTLPVIDAARRVEEVADDVLRTVADGAHDEASGRGPRL